MNSNSSQASRLTPPDGPVLVVGGAGYIGSHTVRMLEESDVPVVVVDDFSTGHRGAVASPLAEVSLGDPDALARVFSDWKPRSVMHFAARCLVGESVENPSVYYRENVQGAWNLLEVMRDAGCDELVFSSTCATYGVPVEVPITEANPQVPINPYGRTKLHIEHMLEDYSKAYGLRFAALRYFNAAGASSSADLGEDHQPETHLIPLLMQVALGQRDSITVFGDDYPTPDGTCVRDYIHIVDLADAHLRALGRIQNGVQQVVCNLGTGSGYSVQEVVEVVRHVTGHPIPTQMGKRRSGDPAQLVSGGSRAREILGWVPTRSSLETIVRDAWRFHQAHPHGFEDKDGS
ncbi:MAG: UDP-glucose 4-epimerase GalE [Myxococcota bacterium]|nr:UDP-glucose 4-epimerase GalE [Deltaproteobacteria bacterium]